MHSLMDVALTPCQPVGYYNEMKTHFAHVMDNAVPEHAAVKKTSKKTGAVPWHIATMQMKAAMDMKLRLEGGGR